MDAQTQAVKVEAFRSERIIITIQLGAKRYKTLQIFFGRDQSLFVNFPYFRHRIGILAAATIPANRQTTSHVNLEVGGRIASHLVKYSHHPNGRAHFSQTGKVRTEIRRQSIALDRQRGHIFSVLIQGLEGFDRADDSKDVGKSPRRTALTFHMGGLPEAEAIKLVGRWFDSSSLGPILTARERDGNQHNGFLLASPYDNARHVLLITCVPIPRLCPEPELLLFYGGFDAREVMDDTAKEAGFLSFLYPAAKAEELKKTIGTVDFSQPIQ